MPVDLQFIETLTNLNIAVFELPAGQKKPQGVSNNEWQKTTPGSVVPSANANYGIIVPNEYIVIDVDLYKANAADSWAKLREAYSVSPSTFTCRSARGGFHYWYKLPRIEYAAGGDTSTISPKHAQFLGVDFLTRRGDKCSYVVGPGSSTADGIYEIVFGDIANCATLPILLYNELSRSHTHEERLTLKKYDEIHGLIDEDMERDRYIEWLKLQPSVVDGEGREGRAFMLAAEGKDYGLIEQCVYTCLRDFWNDRNSPPLKLDVLASKVTNAFKYAKDETGNKAVHIHLFEGFASTNQNDTFVSTSINHTSLNRLVDPKDNNFEYYDDTIYGEWDTDKQTGQIKATSRNLRRLFQSEVICDGKFSFRGLIRYDLLSERPVLSQKPFWRQWNDSSSNVFSDADAIAIKFMFANRYYCEFSITQIMECILESAKRNPFHPVREWLETLEWDGNKRLEHLFLEYFEVMPETLDKITLDYRKSVAKAFVLAAIERVFTPGCKWDQMLTLVGPQGTGKSEFVQILGDKYASVSYAIATDHRTLQALQGGWIVEFPELSSAKKTDVDSIKAFTSTRVDKFIPLHGKSGPQEYPRKSVYAWTLNPPPEGFLRDITGERRFLIINVPTLIDFKSLKEDREQIFAEAMCLYRQGIKAYEVLAHIYDKSYGKSVLESIQEEYKQDLDPWVEILQEALGSREPYTDKTRPTKLVTKGNSQVYVDIDVVEYEYCFIALGLHLANQRGHKEKIRINRALKVLGYDSHVCNSKRRFEKRI